TVDVVHGATVALNNNAGFIASAGANAVVATTQLVVRAIAGITLNISTPALTVRNVTSGNINITQVASPAQALAISDPFGVVNFAAGGSITITNLAGSIPVAAANGVHANDGPVTLAATDFTINGPISSGTARTTLINSAAGAAFDLGSEPGGGTIGLTQTE